ncbi:MAG: hypothetical protein J3R72DRAFT_446080 [Linnemannia gamsii]|nr:MAG: hypothetical protein J3R72DRAFT_446080 [Linnemannia gamsii]
MSSSIRVPMRTRSSSTVSSTSSPTIVGARTFPRSTVPPAHAPSKTSSPPSTLSLSAASGNHYQSQAQQIQAQSQPQSQAQGQAQQGQLPTQTVNNNKPISRRPSLPNFPGPPAPPSQKQSSLAAHLQPIKDIAGLRSPRSHPRLNGADRNDGAPGTSHIARPASSLSSPRSYSSSPSPRLGSSASRFGDSQQRPSVLSHSNNTSSTSNSTTPSLIAKPVSRTQKAAIIKPPSIVTKPNSPNGSITTSHTSMSNTSNASNSTAGGSSSSSNSSASALARSFSLPPIAPSPNTASLQRPFSPTSTTTTTSSFSILSPLIGSNIPTLTSLTAAAAAVAAAVASGSSTSTTTRSKNRLGVDSACYMTRSSSGESLASSSASSSPTSTPVIAATLTMASTCAATGIGTTTPATTATLLPAPTTNSTRKPKSRQLSISNLSPPTSPSARTTTPASPPPKSALKKPSTTKPSLPFYNAGSPTHQMHKDVTSGSTTTVVKCNCPPPLEFPENVKLEMKREEEEHRKRECGLYEKIIELQIENANLQGEKETLNRVLTRRDTMLIELQMQLKAMEFVCRENEIKVDIDMCPDEAIENWSFKESDEVYQRILITTQDLLRTGSKSLEENMVMPRSSSQHQRHTRTSSLANSSTSSTSRSSLGGGSAAVNCSLFDSGFALRKNVVAGLSESAQPLTVQDQEVDPLLFKETSRPGTLKLDLHTLLRSEQEFKSNQVNLAEVDDTIERGGRRAIDGGDDRAGFFRGIASQQQQHNSSISSQEGCDEIDCSSDDEIDDDEDDDEDEESEFEELGEDMIKYVELQSSVAPRRESRASSFSMLMPPGNISAATTPDLSSAVLMKNMWSANGSVRRSASNTPLQHPAFQQHFSQAYHQQHHHHQYSQSHRGSANRSSGGSSLSSNSSLLDDYFARPQFTSSQEQPIVGLGLGLTGLNRSPELGSMERFLSAPHRDAPPPPHRPLPPLPMASPMPHSMSPPRPHPLSCSPRSTDYPATFSSAPPSHYQLHHHLNNNTNVIRPPPMMPLPPLPACPRYSYRDHTKSKLLQSMRPVHGRTCSHGFAIEDVGQFLKRRAYGKTLTRDTMHRGLRRRDSV